ncbi:MAG: outer membrane beta-barrel protein [Paracoccaceae bacterium]|nr:outer membrane beta-barrel protein [Paracoccaceae bacterium]
MKRYLFCLMVTLPFSAHAENFDWSGCSVGLSAGYGQGNNSWTTTYFSGTTYNDYAGSAHSGGALAGGQLACDMQRSNWVMGVQGSLYGANLTGDNQYINGTSPTDRIRYKTNGLLTLAGRAGYLFTPQTLVYAKAGWAWANNEYHDADPNGGPASDYRASKVRDGWLVGLGVEYRYTQKMSLFAELNKMYLGTQTLHLVDTLGGGVTDYQAKVDQDLTTLMVGFNYRF